MAAPTTASSDADKKKGGIYIMITGTDVAKPQYLRIAARNLQRFAKEVGMGQKPKIEEYDATPVDVIDLRTLDKDSARKLYFEIADEG